MKVTKFLQRKSKTTGVLLLAAGLLLVTSVQAGAATTASPKPSPTNPYGAGPIDPAGPNEVILVVAGSSKTLRFTMKELLALKPIRISIFEPFVNKRQQFSVIPLSVLFKKAGIKSSQRVVSKALNNYEYGNTAAEFLAAKGYLAIKRNGTNIPYDQGGPIRLVYPDTSKWTKFLDPWNWSLASITVPKNK